MTATPSPIARSELILGGQKSGKSRRAELLARDWLAQSPQHSALLIATAQPWDDEMRARIQRHQRDRAARVPGMHTLEAPRELAAVLQRESTPHTLIVVDCLTLWLTNWLMPADSAALPLAENSEPNPPPALAWQAQAALFSGATTRPQGRSAYLPRSALAALRHAAHSRGFAGGPTTAFRWPATGMTETSIEAI